MTSEGEPGEEAEELLLQAWAWTDQPSKYEIKALATQAGCEEEQVRAFFGRLRSSVRSYLQKAQKAAKPGLTAAASRARGGGGGGSSAAHRASPAAEAAAAGKAEGPASPQAAAVERATAGREAALRKLRLLLDETGGLRDASKAGQLGAQMAHAEAATVRCAMLHALLATKRSRLAALVQHGGCLLSLEAWLRDGEEDGQATLLLLALEVLEAMPLSPATLRGSPGLPRAVARLHKDRHPQVAAAAKQLSERWQSAGAGPSQAAHAPAAAVAGAAKRGGAAPAAAVPAAEHHQQQQQRQQAGAAAAAAVGAAALRRPSAGEMQTMVALGRKSVFGRAGSAPTHVHASGGAGEEAGTPRAAAAGGASGSGVQGGPVGLLRRQSSGAEAAASPRGALGGLHSALSAGPARTARPMSVDDIRKAKAKERAAAALHSLEAGAGAGQGPGAKRARLGTESPRAIAWPPSATQQQEPQQAPMAGPHHQAAAGGAGPLLAAPQPHVQQWQQQPDGGAGLAAAQHAQQQALAPEAAAALAHYEQDRQRRAVARRARLVQEYAALDEAAARLPAMQPTLASYPPPPLMLLPPLDLPAARGEESTEAAGQRARQAAAQQAAYAEPADVPPSPAEPDSQQPVGVGAAAPPLPFTSIDPSEAAVQNERLWADGIRLPQLVVPPPSAPAPPPPGTRK